MAKNNSKLSDACVENDEYYFQYVNYMSKELTMYENNKEVYDQLKLVYINYIRGLSLLNNKAKRSKFIRRVRNLTDQMHIYYYTWSLMVDIATKR